MNIKQNTSSRQTSSASFARLFCACRHASSLKTEVAEEEFDTLFKKFKHTADLKKTIVDKNIIDLISSDSAVVENHFKLGKKGYLDGWPIHSVE